jgi:hypothetical protein
MMGLPPQDATPASVYSTWTLIDTLGHTIPAGTHVGISDAAGNINAFLTLVDVVVSAGSSATPAGSVQLQAVTPGLAASGLGGVGVAAQLIDTLDFVSTVVLSTATAGGLDAEDDATYLDRLQRKLRLLSTRPILPSDAAILARDVAGVYRAVAIDGFNPFHNLLTLNEASAETDASGWTNLSNTTVGSTAAAAADGSKSVSMTAIASLTTMSMVGAVSKTVVPGETLTAIGSIRAAVTTGRSYFVGIQWRDVSDAILSTVYGTPIAAGTTAFQQAVFTGVAPAGAVKARVTIQVGNSPVLGEVHYADKMSLRHGSTTDWVPGGTTDTGNARTLSVAALDALGADVSGPIQTSILNLLALNREVNFLFYVIGAKRTLIDVTFSAKVATGYTTADVSTRAVAALQAYLNPATWGNKTTDPQDWAEQTFVRYSEVAQVLSNVEGLDYWTVLTIGVHGGTMGTTDIPLPGPAGLAVASTITPTVT